MNKNNNKRKWSVWINDVNQRLTTISEKDFSDMCLMSNKFRQSNYMISFGKISTSLFDLDRKD